MVGPLVELGVQVAEQVIAQVLVRGVGSLWNWKKAQESRLYASSRAVDSAVFLHFVNHHYLEIVAPRLTEEHYKEATLATKLALLAADRIIITASSFVESNVCRSMVAELGPELVESGRVVVTGSAATFGDYLDSKLGQYEPRGRHHNRYQVSARLALPWLPREMIASEATASAWLAESDSGALWSVIHDLPRRNMIVDEWEQVPSRLEGKEFVMDHAEVLLPTLCTNAHAFQRVSPNWIIIGSYLNSNIQEFGACIMSGLDHLHSPRGLAASQQIHYSGSLVRMGSAGILEEFRSLQFRDFVNPPAKLEKFVRCLDIRYD